MCTVYRSPCYSRIVWSAIAGPWSPATGKQGGNQHQSQRGTRCGCGQNWTAGQSYNSHTRRTRL